MNSNKLTMNLEKTQCLLISTKSKLWKCKNLYIKVGVVILNSEGKGWPSLCNLRRISYLVREHEISKQKNCSENKYVTSSLWFMSSAALLKI